MSAITVPTVPLNHSVNGDITLYDSGNADLGLGSLYLTSSSANLYNSGLTNLSTTRFTLNNGALNIIGTNGITGTMTGAVSLVSGTTGNLYSTTVGTITLSSTNATGQTIVSSAGAGPSSVLLNATNTTDGQIALTSAGNSTSSPSILLNSTATTGGGISLTSASNSTSVKSISLTATNATNGSILLSGAGNFIGSVPAISLLATSVTSGQILVSSASDNTSTPAIIISGTSATGAAVNITSAGPGTSNGSIFVNATNSSGRINLSSAGTGANAITLTSSAGGISATATGLVNITTTSTGSGVTIATGTAGVPVVIGTSTSLTTIAGNLLVSGTTTSINTVSTLITDNILTLNAGPGAVGLDSGISLRRFQAPGASVVGDVVTNPGPIQESGTFQAGSSTPGTVVLSAFASSTNNFYTGWFVVVTSGTGINQVRRIKTYNGTTKTATLYVTADNTSQPTYFGDGLDLVTAPAASDTYNLFAEVNMCVGYIESTDSLNLISSSTDPGQTTISPVQYIDNRMGKTTIQPKVYNNAKFTASASVNIVVTIKAHALVIGNKVRISNSTDVGITNGVYSLTAVTTDTFTFVAPTSITSVAASSLTATFLETSILYVNQIALQDAGYGTLSIPGIFSSTIIQLLKTSSGVGTGVTLSAVIGITGSFFVKVSDQSGTGASATFSLSNNGSSTGSISTITQIKGGQNQRLNISWLTGASPVLFHSNAGSGGGNYSYDVKVY